MPSAVYHLLEMKKQQITRRLAKESNVPTVVAADQVDRIVSDLLRRVRKGESASLPGLGTFQSGSQQEFQFERELAPKAEPAPPKKGGK
ncbi:MAG TPA: HU family DNA-binding protein [Bryobacteraceae bacterium]|nr:HU family DNA-binding protein [Bryobacteraceae bacterium]